LDVTVQEDLTRLAMQALDEGNGPKKALEHFLNGAQGIHSLALSVMHYYGRDRDNPAVWKMPVTAAVARMEEPSPGEECLDDDEEELV
jgi:hypothetical protein